MLKWLAETYTLLKRNVIGAENTVDPDDIFADTVASGCLESVKWFYSNFHFTEEEKTSTMEYVLKVAAEDGYSDMLEWVFENLNLTEYSRDSFKDYVYQDATDREYEDIIGWIEGLG